MSVCGHVHACACTCEHTAGGRAGGSTAPRRAPGRAGPAAEHDPDLWPSLSICSPALDLFCGPHRAFGHLVPPAQLCPLAGAPPGLLALAHLSLMLQRVTGSSTKPSRKSSPSGRLPQNFHDNILLSPHTDRPKNVLLGHQTEKFSQRTHCPGACDTGLGDRCHRRVLGTRELTATQQLNSRHPRRCLRPARWVVTPQELASHHGLGPSSAPSRSSGLKTHVASREPTAPHATSQVCRGQCQARPDAPSPGPPKAGAPHTPRRTLETPSRLLSLLKSLRFQ